MCVFAYVLMYIRTHGGGLVPPMQFSQKPELLYYIDVTERYLCHFCYLYNKENYKTCARMNEKVIC